MAQIGSIWSKLAQVSSHISSSQLEVAQSGSRWQPKWLHNQTLSSQTSRGNRKCLLMRAPCSWACIYLTFGCSRQPHVSSACVLEYRVHNGKQIYHQMCVSRTLLSPEYHTSVVCSISPNAAKGCQYARSDATAEDGGGYGAFTASQQVPTAMC